MTIYTRLFAVISLLLFSLVGFAQNATFDDVYNLLQVKCTACHGGSSPQGGMDLSGTPLDVYNTLVGTNPVNPAAAAKGYDRVAAGYPERSFILHKLATDEWDDTFGLEPADGNSMPPSPLPALEKKEVELIRQWILFGAPIEGTVVDPQILEDYYDNGMALPTTDALDPPAAGEGYQLRLGPIFLAPLEEREYYKKHDPLDNSPYEVNSMDIAFNDESHHFILYKMSPAIGNSYEEGLRNVEDSDNAMVNNTLVAAWQNAEPFTLPANTAYKFTSNTQLDLNYHLKNYSVSGVLAANVYINIYTQAPGTAEEEMYSQLFPISLFDFFLGAPLGSGLEIPADGAEHTFTEYFWIPDLPAVPFEGGTWHIWQLSTHTHERGVDYDIYLALDQNGTKGEQIFEGFYNYDYTFNQGFYDWAHPPVRFFEPLLPVNMDLGGGIVHEAKYINDEDETLYWGNSVNDEMMLIFMHYTLNAVTPTEEVVAPKTFEFQVFPNPVADFTQIRYQLEKEAMVQLSLYDLQGRQLWNSTAEQQPAGRHDFQLDCQSLQLSTGAYLLKIYVDGQSSTKEIVVE